MSKFIPEFPDTPLSDLEKNAAKKWKNKAKAFDQQIRVMTGKLYALWREIEDQVQAEIQEVHGDKWSRSKEEAPDEQEMYRDIGSTRAFFIICYKEYLFFLCNSDEIRPAEAAWNTYCDVVSSERTVESRLKANGKAIRLARNAVQPILASGSADEIKMARLLKPTTKKTSIRRRPKKIGELLGVPELPYSPVRSPELIHSLVRAFRQGLLPRRSTQIPPCRYYALTGMPGSGKTVLAISIANDADVRAMFPDGIIWIQHAKQVDTIKSQRALGQYLESSSIDQFDDSLNNTGRLTKLLHRKACLVIVDDAWNKNDVEALGFPGHSSAVLITTQLPIVADSLVAQSTSVERPEKSHALEIMAFWARRKGHKLPPEALEVAEICQHLPFALALCGALAASGRSWTTILDQLRNRSIDKISHGIPQYPHESLWKALSISVEALPRSPVDLREQLLDLAIFPDRYAIPPAPVKKLWDFKLVPRADQADTLFELKGRSLLAPLQDGTYWIHGLLHDYLAKAFGHSVADAHDTLLRAYAGSTVAVDQVDTWLEIEDDGYIVNNLAFHCSSAGRQDLLKALLLSPRWLIRRLHSANVYALLDDFALLDSKTRGDLQEIEVILQRISPTIARFPEQFCPCFYGELLSSTHTASNALLRDMNSLIQDMPLRPIYFDSRDQDASMLRAITVRNAYPLHVSVSENSGIALLLWSSGVIQLWDLLQPRLQSEFQVEGIDFSNGTYAVEHLASSADARRLVAISTNAMWLVDIRDGQTVCVDCPGADFTCVALSQGGNLVLAGGKKGLWRFDVSAKKWLEKLSDQGSVDGVAIFADSLRAISWEWAASTLQLWDLQKGSRERNIQVLAHEVASGRHNLPTHVKGLTLSSDGSETLLLSETNLLPYIGRYPWYAVDVVSTHDGLLCHSFTPESHTRCVNVAWPMLDEEQVVLGDEDGQLVLLDLTKKTPPQEISGHAAPIVLISGSSTHQVLVSGGMDGVVRVWKLKAFRQERHGPKRLQCSTPISGASIAVTHDRRFALASVVGRVGPGESSHGVRVISLKPGSYRHETCVFLDGTSKARLVTGTSAGGVVTVTGGYYGEFPEICSIRPRHILRDLQKSDIPTAHRIRPSAHARVQETRKAGECKKADQLIANYQRISACDREGDVTDVFISSNGKWALILRNAAAAEAVCDVVSIEDARIISTICFATSDRSLGCISDSGQRFALVYRPASKKASYALEVWNTITGEPIKRVVYGDLTQVLAMDDGTVMVYQPANSTVFQFESATWRCINKVPVKCTNRLARNYCVSAGVARTGNVVMVRDGAVVSLWDKESGRAIGAFVNDDDIVASTLSEDGTTLALLDRSGRALIFQVGAEAHVSEKFWKTFLRKR